MEKWTNKRKTFSIREFGKRYESFIEINFFENKTACSLFENAKSSDEILLRLSLITEQKLIPGQTLIFLDEVQKCRELITAIKFLVEEGSYQYVLSGSLLGVDLKDIRSIPVGYMDIVEMYPLDFEEFAVANGVSDRVLRVLQSAFEKEQEVIHEQKSILEAYKKDISKYDPENKLYLEDIFDLIPSELNCKNKRFILKNLNENFKFSRYSNSFVWLKDSGCVCVP